MQDALCCRGSLYIFAVDFAVDFALQFEAMFHVKHMNTELNRCPCCFSGQLEDDT